MDQREARRRFTAARVGRLATTRPQGTPHLVPVVFALVDDVVYSAVDSKPKTTTALQRLVNVDATGRASILVDEYSEDWSSLWWIRVDGSAKVLPPDGGEHQEKMRRPGRPDQVGTAIEALTRKYPQYLSQPPMGPVIAIRLSRWQTWEATPTP